MARGFERPPVWFWPALIVAVVLLAVGLPYAAGRGEVPSDQIAAAQASQRAVRAAEQQARADAEAAEAARIDVAVLGDSYTGGSQMDSGVPFRFPALLTAQYPWNVTPYAIGGTGFVNGQGEAQDFPSRAAAIVAASPQVVVVEGGHNDARATTDEVRTAIASTLTTLRAGLPDASLVVLGAIWPGEAPPQVDRIDAALAEEAANVGAVFVDTSAWFSGEALALIGSDGTHPTDAGHAELARRVADALVAAGVPTAV